MPPEGGAGAGFHSAPFAGTEGLGLVPALECDAHAAGIAQAEQHGDAVALPRGGPCGQPPDQSRNGQDQAGLPPPGWRMQRADHIAASPGGVVSQVDHRFGTAPGRRAADGPAFRVEQHGARGARRQYGIEHAQQRWPIVDAGSRMQRKGDGILSCRGKVPHCSRCEHSATSGRSEGNCREDLGRPSRQSHGRRCGDDQSGGLVWLALDSPAQIILGLEQQGRQPASADSLTRFPAAARQTQSCANDRVACCKVACQQISGGSVRVVSASRHALRLELNDGPRHSLADRALRRAREGPL